MKKLLALKVWPIFAGLVTALVAMMIFEYVNSFIYPLPIDLVLTDAAAVKAFTISLPWTAYILVLAGWVVGSFNAGYVTTFLSKEKKYRLSLIVAIILTIAGIANNLLIGHHLLFNIIGLPMFLVFTYLGHRFRVKTR